jgi:hypothetical protein
MATPGKEVTLEELTVRIKRLEETVLVQATLSRRFWKSYNNEQGKGGGQMKSLSCGLILATVLLMCLGCATSNINKIQNKWGPPAKTETVGTQTIYYYYFIEESGAIVPIGRVWVDNRKGGWMCYEFTCDQDGKIVKKRKYWAQPGR